MARYFYKDDAGKTYFVAPDAKPLCQAPGMQCVYCPLDDQCIHCGKALPPRSRNR